MASAFAVPFILTFVLNVSTCDSVRIANYVLTLQEYPAGRDDLIESYFHLGLEYTEILWFLVFSHGINLSLRQLKRILKAKELGRRRNASDLRRLERVFRCYIACETMEDYKEGCLMVWANYMSPCNSIIGLYFKVLVTSYQLPWQRTRSTKASSKFQFL